MDFNVVLFSYGGVTPQTHECLIRDLCAGGCKNDNIHYATAYNDALIDRVRSTIATKFLELI
jgi:hypothetical protein